jgi:VIT1/CCC1 family predicted Fe2+/Mn2+ transporter
MYGSVDTLRVPLRDSINECFQAGDEPHDHTHDPPDSTFRAVVFGFSDGLLTNVNLVVGLFSVLRPHTVDDTLLRAYVVMTGTVGLFAGASSMACGEWLSKKAEAESLARELERESTHLRTMPETEAAHMKEIFMQSGLSDTTADAINAEVARLPIVRQAAFHGKFELGIDSHDASLKGAAYIWLAFAAGALIPIVPWFVARTTTGAFAGTVCGTAVGLLATACYQVRGHCNVLHRVALRQLLVTALAVGLTVGCNALFFSRSGLSGGVL